MKRILAVDNDALVRKLEEKVTELESKCAALEEDSRQRHQVEEALRRSEERWCLIYEHEPECVKIVSQEGLLVTMNPAGLAMIDADSLDEVRGKPLLELVMPEHREAFRALHQKVIAGQSGELEFEIIGLRGTRRWLETHAAPLPNSDGTVSLLGITRDITERKRAEESLRESEARYRLLADNTDDFISLHDTQGNRLYISSSYFRVTGWTFEEVQSTDWRTRQHPDDLPMLERIRAANLAGEPTLVEHRIRCKDGSWIWVELRCKPIKASDGRVSQLLMWSRDITARKRAEQAVRDNEALLMGLVNTALDAIITIDDEHYIVLFNPAAERIFQCSGADVLGKPIQQLIPERFHAAHGEQIRQFGNAATTVRPMGERRPVMGRRRDGHEFPAEASILKFQVGDRRYFTVILRDISERKRSEETLRDSEARLRMLVQSGEIGLWDWNLLTNEVYFSPEWKRQVGCSDAEIPGRYEEWEGRLHPDDRDRALAAVSDFRAGRRSDYDVEFRLRHKDGSWRWILARADLLYDAEGQPSHMMGCHVDITERMRSEELLKEREQQLRLFVEHSPAAIAMFDADMRYLLASRRWLSDYNLGLRTLTGLSHYDVFPEIPERWKEIHRRCLAGVVETCEEDPFVRGDGHTDWVRWEVRPWRKIDGQIGGLIMFTEVITARKQAEQALRDSELRFRTLIEQAADALFVHDFQGRFLDINRSAYESLGYAREELLSLSVADVAVGVPMDELLLVWDQLKPDQPITIMGRYRRKDGSEFPVEVRLGLIDGDSVRVVLAIVRDITERERVETALAAERQLLRTMADNLPAYVFVKDTAGRYLFVNQTHARQLGRNSEVEMLGKTAFDFFPANIARLYDDDDKKVLQTGQPIVEREEPFEVKGTLGWFLTTKVALRDAQGKITGLVGIALDITERKQAQRALADERNLLRTLVDHIPDFIFVKDTQSRQLLNNAANMRLIGARTDAEVAGKTVFDLYPREQAQQYYDEDQRVMRTGQAQLNQEESVLDLDGQEHWLLSSKVPLRDAEGNCIGLVGIKRDITAHRQANTELAASRQRLEILSRQLIAAQESERRHLARELHDEIGQALTGIKLNLKALQQAQAPKLQKPAQETIDVVDQKLQLRFASRSDSATLQDTIDVVDQTLQQVRNLALDLRPSMLDDLGLVAALRWSLDRQSQRAGFAAQFLVEPADCAASQDIETACFRVVQECLTNIARHAQSRQVLVKLRQRGGELELLVRDDGIGFDVAAARGRAARGESLGLLGMQERVQLVGGQLDIESAPNLGTTIRARFPWDDATLSGRDGEGHEQEQSP